MKILDIFAPKTRTPMPGRPGMVDKRDATLEPVQGFQSISRGLEVFAEADLRVREEEARTWASMELSKARLKWSQEMINRQGQWTPDKQEGFTPPLMEGFGKYADEVVSRAPTESARRYVQERFMDLQADVGNRAMVFEANARIDHRKDQFKQMTDNLSRLMNTDPTQYRSALAEQMALIDADTTLPQIAKSQVKEELLQRVSGAAVYSQIQRSPTAFLQSIGFYQEGQTGDGKTRRSSGDLQGLTGNTAFDALSFEKRIQLFSHAITEKARIDADADKAAVARRKELAGNVSKELWEQFYTGKLTRSTILTYKSVLDENDFKALLEANNRGPVRRDNPSALMQITNEMYRDPISARSMINNLYRSGQLSDDTYRTEMSRTHSLERESGPRTPYERTRNFINNSLNPGDMVDDPVRRQRMANALRDYDNWIMTAPVGKPYSDADIQKRGQEIIDQYKFIDLSETIVSLPVPRGTTIRRVADKKVLNEDIVKAGLTLQQKRDKGELTQAEYENEMRTLSRWKRIAQ